jgi:hypothetical protein
VDGEAAWRGVILPIAPVSRPRKSLRTNAIFGHVQITSLPSTCAGDLPTMCAMRTGKIAACGLLLSLVIALHGAAGSPITDVSIAPSFFNPTAGQNATITFRADVAGTARVSILDRDRFVIRTLAPVAVRPGVVTIAWNGRDDRAAIVPDEAWNIRIELAGGVYDPSLHFMPVTEDPQPRMYSPVNGVLSFRLSRPSRVHVQAGQARRVGGRYTREGPMIRTIVDREPRVSGPIVERWNGFDESGTIRVSSLPNFVISVLATSLPDNSLITRGNHERTFVEYARQHRPASALAVRKRTTPVHHHAGLNVFEDQIPALDVKRTKTRDGGLRLDVRVDGPASGHFLGQPGSAMVYVDEKRVVLRGNPSNPLRVTIPAGELVPGARVVVNWCSAYGPVATSAFLFDPPARTARVEVKR